MNDNLKWLLLIPVVIVAISLGYVIPKVFGSGEDGPPKREKDPLIEQSINRIRAEIDEAEKIATNNPANTQIALDLGLYYNQLGMEQDKDGQVSESLASYKTAIDYYRKYLAGNPNGHDARIDMGLTYLYMSMPEVAERELLTATQLLPANQRAWHSLGFIQWKGLGKTAEASQAFQTSYTLDPTSTRGIESKKFLDKLNADAAIDASNQIVVPPAP